MEVPKNLRIMGVSGRPGVPVQSRYAPANMIRFAQLIPYSYVIHATIHEISQT